MAAQVVRFTKDEALNPGATAVITLTLLDEAGVAINAGAVTSIRATLQDLTNTGEIINSRNNQDILAAGSGPLAVLTNGLLTLNMKSADTVLVSGQSKPYQERLLLITLNYTGPGVLVIAVYYWVRNPRG